LIGATQVLTLGVSKTETAIVVAQQRVKRQEGAEVGSNYLGLKCKVVSWRMQNWCLLGGGGDLWS